MFGERPRGPIQSRKVFRKRSQARGFEALVREDLGAVKKGRVGAKILVGGTKKQGGIQEGNFERSPRALKSTAKTRRRIEKTEAMY